MIGITSFSHALISLLLESIMIFYLSICEQYFENCYVYILSFDFEDSSLFILRWKTVGVSYNLPFSWSQALYRLGARKIALFGLGQLGCTPFEMARYGTNGSSCVDIINNAVQIFNNRLKSLVDDLNNSLSGATFIYMNTYSLAAGDASSAGID